MDDLRVTGVRCTAAPVALRDHGLIGFVGFILNDSFAIDGVQLRRTRGGRTTLSYGRRTVGREHQYFFRPITNQARLAIEAQVCAALGLQQETAP